MEEYVGKVWHRWITRAADSEHPAAAVTLDEVRVRLGVLFRAFGGDGGLKVDAAPATEYRRSRRWLQRVAGSGTTVHLAYRDIETLRLPPRIALFPDPELNRQLYTWLAALAAGEDTPGLPRPWLSRNQALSCRALERFPGLSDTYRRLVKAHLVQRPAPEQLPEDAAAQERVIRVALETPERIAELPRAEQLPTPVPLWLHPSPPLSAVVAASEADQEGEPGEGKTIDPREQRRRQAQRVEMPDGDDGLVALRMENILSWAEYVKVDRTTDEDEDGEAERAAEDMDMMAVARDGQSTAQRLRFDLDLPSAEYDDTPLGEGVTLPEWDFRKRLLKPDFCRIQPMVAREAGAIELPEHLRRTARRLRNQFEALARTRQWHRSQPDGSEIDLDAYLHFAAERLTGRAVGEPRLYRALRTGERDLACLLLADISLSTDAAVNDDAKVIDVVRDSLHLFTEALAATGDRFAVYGFSSKKRHHVRFHTIKEFDERPAGMVRGRINAIRPGYYTRMGAALRHATEILAKEPAHQQLLLLITDGKPNDLDQYEGRYGVEDTRVAVQEARQRGLQPFCVTIDHQAGDYLPHLFGPNGYVVIRNPEELPRRLPQLYARLTA